MTFQKQRLLITDTKSNMIRYGESGRIEEIHRGLF